MSLRLYLDDSIYDRQLRRMLDQGGYAAVIPADAGLTGARDPLHFAYAHRHGLVLATKNPPDFVRLATATPDHPGLLLVYRDNDVTRDMTAADIVRAIGNLVASGVPLGGHIHVLNHWRY